MMVLSRKFNFTFKISGPFKYRDVHLEYENKYFSFIFRIDLIHLYIIWLKIRLFLKGIYFNIKLNSKKYKATNEILYQKQKKLVEDKDEDKQKKEFNKMEST